MIKNLKLNLEVLEGMNYFWTATKEREKVGENFLVSIGENSHMKAFYNEEFKSESVRKCLSAISNREPYHGTKQEMRFWNNNMWMLEDMGIMELMLSPLKVLNLDSLKENISDVQCDNIEVVFLPGSMEVYKMDKVNKRLFVNFFRVWVDINTGEVSIEDIPLNKWLENKIRELLA